MASITQVGGSFIKALPSEQVFSQVIDLVCFEKKNSEAMFPQLQNSAGDVP